VVKASKLEAVETFYIKQLKEINSGGNTDQVTEEAVRSDRREGPRANQEAGRANWEQTRGKKTSHVVAKG
jgi:hypothetical protein